MINSELWTAVKGASESVANGRTRIAQALTALAAALSVATARISNSPSPASSSASVSALISQVTFGRDTSSAFLLIRIYFYFRYWQRKIAKWQRTKTNNGWQFAQPSNDVGSNCIRSFCHCQSCCRRNRVIFFGFRKMIEASLLCTIGRCCSKEKKTKWNETNGWK